ncbi:RES family NAD+ phosphorylase [Agrobacterium genomosp. 3]|uniref:RES family NAD+ phosphorylase n=1 Tax=Agrobacterium tomkonis TaxID=1183410 RepID=UPI001CD86F53|nr:RES family NAD+ phosphorylase [Agrobacterium tomkonis]MCA1878665.1 RES family NAD+ phosphorylase [Agrobacterium tumefaciens]MCA1893890.1 RES family NAD+ phosphorylase [Agrobacterium tomkonis]
MKLSSKTVRDLALAFRPESYLRIVPAAHMLTPLGMGFGQSRFSSPNRIFRLLYAAYDLATAIAETIVRDRFEGTQDRVLDESEIEEWAVTEVTATDPLILLDLRTTGLLRLGVSTDAARAKEHREGQILSEEVYSSYAVDGLLYSSRLTAADCVAVYDRAVGAKLVASPAVELVRQADLISALRSIGVSIRAGR